MLLYQFFVERREGYTEKHDLLKKSQRMERVIPLCIVKKNMTFLVSCCMTMQSWLKIIRGSLLQPV